MSVSVWLCLGLVVPRFTGERFNLKPVLNVICMICCNGSFTLPETDSDSDSFPTEMGCRDWSLSLYNVNMFSLTSELFRY